MTEDEELYHYGVKGMKWGVRKKRNARNPNYSDKQVRRDRQVYGKRGSRRINRDMNKGDNLSLARGSEKTRRDSTMRRNKYARVAGQITGGLAGAGIGRAAIAGLAYANTTQHGSNFIAKFVGSDRSPLGMAFNRSLYSKEVQAAAAAGGALLGRMIGGDVAVAANMRGAGYDPRRR